MARSATLGILLLVSQTLAGAASDSSGSKVGNFRSVATKFWVEHAIQDAARRLHDPECQRVLTDLSDPQGNSLDSRLTTLGVSAADYLTKWLYVVDGSDNPQCDPKLHVAAFTQRGRRVMFICAPHGLDAAFSPARSGTTVIIHEMLHSLGLGENPPSSRQITQRVVKRCGG